MLRQPDDKTRDVALAFLRSLSGNAPDATAFKKAAKIAGVTKKQLEFWYAADAAGVTLASHKAEAIPQISPGDAAVSPALHADQLHQLSDALDEAEDDLFGSRPMPTEDLCEPAGFRDDDEGDAPIRVAPDHDLGVWVRHTFIEPGGSIFNEDHWHLADARIGFLWTNVENVKNGQRIIGTAELVATLGNKWQTARDHFQLLKWFGEVPDFIITLDAPVWITLDDASACALVEHELYHCSLKLDRDGNPRETPDGDLIFALRGHDIEQFIPVVERYGARAADVEAIIEAARRGPTIAQARIHTACGNCRR